MRPGMTPNIENSYVNKIDRQKSLEGLRGQGLPAEDLVALFYSGVPGLKARFSTPEEDKGPEIGGRQTVDIVVSYSDGKPAFATQITSNTSRDIMQKKLQEMQDHPFIRLEDMGVKDSAIPKILVVLDAKQVKEFFESPDLAKHPELALKVIDDHIRSLTFDLSKTKNPFERKAVGDLIEMFKQERKKYIH